MTDNNDREDEVNNDSDLVTALGGSFGMDDKTLAIKGDCGSDFDDMSFVTTMNDEINSSFNNNIGSSRSESGRDEIQTLTVAMDKLKDQVSMQMTANGRLFQGTLAISTIAMLGEMSLS